MAERAQARHCLAAESLGFCVRLGLDVAHTPSAPLRMPVLASCMRCWHLWAFVSWTPSCLARWGKGEGGGSAQRVREILQCALSARCSDCRCISLFGCTRPVPLRWRAAARNARHLPAACNVGEALIWEGGEEAFPCVVSGSTPTCAASRAAGGSCRCAGIQSASQLWRRTGW